MERFVERFRYKATKAKQAQSRIKQIDKIKRDGASAEQKDRRNLRFSFADAGAARPHRRSNSSAATIEVPGRTLLEDAELEVESGEHVVLVGPNGAGKTTLIETLAGRTEPAAGSVREGHNVKVGYLSQHADTAAGEGTVLDAVQRETGLSGPKARHLLGGFLFSGSDAQKSLSDISGGEQRRLSLAVLVASGANVLILDEPTNHLDVESREALEDALLAFEGAVILVSHDRALLEAIGSRTLVCENGELRSHPVRLGHLPARARRARVRRRRRGEAGEGEGRALQLGEALPEGGAEGGPACRADRARRSQAARGRGGARRPRGLVDAGEGRAGRGAPRGRQAGGAGALRALGGGRGAGRPGDRSGLSEPSLQPDPGAAAGGEGDVADLDLLRPRVGGAELGPLEDRAQDDLHLVFGEGGADAAPDAAAEGDPGVVVRLAVEEALGLGTRSASGKRSSR